MGPLEPDSAELESLLTRCARQDHLALKELYREVSPLLLAMLLRMLQSRELAEDGLQDVFVRIWYQAGQFEARRGRALAWIISIARYRAIDMHRGRSRRAALEDAPERTVSEIRPATSWTQRALERCLALWTGEQRHSLVLAYEHGFTHEQLAASLGYPLGTVKSWVRRALTSLRKGLES